MAKISDKNRILLNIKRPHVTEKSSMLSANTKPAYTFLVDKKANKTEIAKAIKEIYKLEPVKVNIVNLPEKEVFSKGKWGTKSAIKKAVVYLKKGEKIDIV